MSGKVCVVMLCCLVACVAGVLSYAVIERTLKNSGVILETDKGDRTIIYKTIGYYVMLCTVNEIMYLILWSRYCENAKVRMILYCASFTLLLILSVIDWKIYTIPPWINICIFVLGAMQLVTDFKEWHSYIIGFFVVSGFLCLLYWWSDGSWIGGGDIKLMAAAGLLLGWKLILVAFVAGCALGSVIHVSMMAMSKGERMLAFGPYLSLGIVVSMIWGEQLAGWYLSLIVV